MHTVHAGLPKRLRYWECKQMSRRWILKLMLACFYLYLTDQMAQRTNVTYAQFDQVSSDTDTLTVFQDSGLILNSVCWIKKHPLLLTSVGIRCNSKSWVDRLVPNMSRVKDKTGSRKPQKEVLPLHVTLIPSFSGAGHVTWTLKCFPCPLTSFNITCKTYHDCKDLD